MAAAVAALSVCFTGQALAQASSPLPDDLAKVVMDWGLCRGRVVNARIKGSETAAAIAEDARQACEGDEGRMRALVTQHFGVKAPGIIDQIMQGGRAQIMAQVDQARSGKAFSDPSVAWGDCVGKRIRAAAPGAADRKSVVDQAFAACRDVERKTQADLEASMTHDQAESVMTQLRGMAREQADKLVAQAQQAR